MAWDARGLGPGTVGWCLERASRWSASERNARLSTALVPSFFLPSFTEFDRVVQPARGLVFAGL